MTAPKIPFSVLVAFVVTLTVAEVLALQHPLIMSNPNFSLIVTLDLAVVAPVVYFLLLRRLRPVAWQNTHLHHASRRLRQRAPA